MNRAELFDLSPGDYQAALKAACRPQRPAAVAAIPAVPDMPDDRPSPSEMTDDEVARRYGVPNVSPRAVPTHAREMTKEEFSAALAKIKRTS